jgi:hypothetical protein
MGAARQRRTVAADQLEVRHAIAPRADVAVKSSAPKFMPTTLVVRPPLDGAFGVIDVITGQSKEKTATPVPRDSPIAIEA